MEATATATRCAGSNTTTPTTDADFELCPQCGQLVVVELFGMMVPTADRWGQVHNLIGRFVEHEVRP